MHVQEIRKSTAAKMFVDDDAVVVCQDKNGLNNLITVAWKSIGQLWSKPVIIIAIKPSRYSHEILESGVGEFTINFGGKVEQIKMACGTMSGRNIDKAKRTETELISCDVIKVPIIKGALYSYCCKIIHTTDSGKITDHTLYFGEIMGAYSQDNE